MLEGGIPIIKEGVTLPVDSLNKSLEQFYAARKR